MLYRKIIIYDMKIKPKLNIMSKIDYLDIRFGIIILEKIVAGHTLLS